MHLTRDERETVITMNDADGHMTVWTAQKPMIRKLKNNPQATLVKEGVHGSSPWAYFHVPADLLTIRSARRRRTDEQRAAASARMAAMHEARRDQGRYVENAAA